eukprot:scaffold6030_cov199-Amphora_coffeaeformis.AAC.3
MSRAILAEVNLLHIHTNKCTKGMAIAPIPKAHRGHNELSRSSWAFLESSHTLAIKYAPSASTETDKKLRNTTSVMLKQKRKRALLKRRHLYMAKSMATPVANPAKMETGMVIRPVSLRSAPCCNNTNSTQ